MLLLSTAATAALGLASAGAAGVVGGNDEPETPLEQTGGQTTATAGAGSPTSGAGGSPTGGAGSGGSPTGGATGSPTARGPATGSGLSDDAAGMSSAELAALVGGSLAVLGGGAYIAARRPNRES